MKHIKIIKNTLLILFLISISLYYLSVDSFEEKLAILTMFNFTIIGIHIVNLSMDKTLDSLTKVTEEYNNFSHKLKEQLWKAFDKITELEKEIKYYKSKTLKCFDSNCEGTLVPMSSINKKKCTDCKVEWDWNLDPGQKSTVIEGLNFDNCINSKAELVSLGCKIEDSKDDKDDS